MSTRNYYILCFLGLPGINLGNKGSWLWKVSKSLAGRGFRFPICFKNGAGLSRLEVRLGRNHLLVQDAHDLNVVGFQNEKHNVLANLKAA